MITISRAVTLGRRISCQCRGKCNTKYCPCRRSGNQCSSGCHSKIRGNCNNKSSSQKSSIELNTSEKRVSIAVTPEKTSREEQSKLSDIPPIQLIDHHPLENDDSLDVENSDCESLDHLTYDTSRLTMC